MSNPKLAVIYRACPLEHGKHRVREARPFNFNKCDNFLNICQNHKDDIFFDIDIHVVFDGDRNDFFLGDIIAKCGAEAVLFTKNSGNLNSYVYCLDYAKALITQGKLNSNNKKYDLFYFLEDDYSHKPQWSKILFDGYLLSQKDKRTIISLYDHPDRYSRNDDIDYGLKIFTGNYCHWRSSESTTCTYAVTTDDYNEIYETARNFGINDRMFFRQIIQNSGYKLITPIPAVATHLHVPFISPYFY